jgi:hypothetical protein
MLLDEVEKDGIYELVVTDFHGGAFTRYRVGDFIGSVVQDSGIPYVDWTARKEYHEGQVHLAIDIEPKSEDVDVSLYADAEAILKTDPLRVTLLPSGAFKHFLDARRKAGTDFAYLKPSHMQISDADLHVLMGAKNAGS